jgi:hypothetical protein
MVLQVVGTGVGRTGTNSLKVALERVLGGCCHHMHEVFAHPDEIPVWIEAVEGRPVDWTALMQDYTAQVDWPGASFWRELTAANPEALVLLSVRDPEEWYRSCRNTIFVGLSRTTGEGAAWMASMRKLLADRFGDHLEDPEAMIEAYERHNAEVRREVAADRLLEWNPADGWDPICARLGVPVPDEPFPIINTTAEFRQNLGLAPLP